MGTAEPGRSSCSVAARKCSQLWCPGFCPSPLALGTWSRAPELCVAAGLHGASSARLWDVAVSGWDEWPVSPCILGFGALSFLGLLCLSLSTRMGHKSHVCLHRPEENQMVKKNPFYAAGKCHRAHFGRTFSLLLFNKTR